MRCWRSCHGRRPEEVRSHVELPCQVPGQGALQLGLAHDGQRQRYPCVLRDRRKSGFYEFPDGRCSKVQRDVRIRSLVRLVDLGAWRHALPSSRHLRERCGHEPCWAPNCAGGSNRRPSSERCCGRRHPFGCVSVRSLRPATAAGPGGHREETLCGDLSSSRTMVHDMRPSLVGWRATPSTRAAQATWA